MLLFVAILAGIYSAYLLVQTVRPLTERSLMTAAEWQRVEDESIELLHRRDRLIEELRDLEFEAALDKIGGQDLKNIRARFEREALNIDRALEERVDTYRDRIEAAVVDRLDTTKAAKTAAKSDAAPTSAASEVSVKTSAEASATAEASEGLPCNACGVVVADGDRFCDACGAAQVHACGACGAENRPNARFCKGCGHDLAEEAKS
jgi:hypothetical protein